MILCTHHAFCFEFNMIYTNLPHKIDDRPLFDPGAPFHWKPF